MTLPLIFILSLLTFKYIETPFRRESFIGNKKFFIGISLLSLILIFFGLYLNKSYGIPSRFFNSEIKISHIDKRLYNERVYAFKKDSFSSVSGNKILIIGNSFARDFVNISTETFPSGGYEIIYRDDLDQCVDFQINKSFGTLFTDADIIVFASGNVREDCFIDDILFAKLNFKSLYYIGTKNFGYNINWLSRISESERANKFNFISQEIISYDLFMSKIVPQENYISLLSSVLKNGQIPITDDLGRVLTVDRAHLTKYGAIYFGEKVIRNSAFSDHFQNTRR
jgi:hypothetical protein